MQWPSLSRSSHSYQLVDEAKDNSSSPSPQLLSRTQRRLAFWRISCIISCIGTCICLLALIVDRTGIAIHSMTIKNSPQYRDFTHAGDKAWDDLLTPNYGFWIRLIDGKKEPWGISMFHQLHCLSMMRSSYQSLLLGEDSEHSHRRAENGTIHEIPEHITHCYDYLRQNILCAADGTIEEPEIVPNETVVTGYGISHRCGNSKKLYDLSIASGVIEDKDVEGMSPAHSM